MTVVKTLEVHSRGRSEQRLWGCRIDSPVVGERTKTYALGIAGWALGRTLPVTGVEIVSENTVLRRVPLDVPRPDIAAAFSEVPDAERSGFQTTIGLLDGTQHFKYQVRAVLRDDSRIVVGTIRGQRESLRSAFRPTLQPLMVTSLGRTGTTWLMRLLSEHPGIVVHRHYPYELRTARYWMHVLRVLSEPANHYQSANFENFQASRWFIGHNPFYSPPLTDNPDLGYWFGRTYVEQLATFCQRSIEDCYQLSAASQHQPEPVYFAEKHVPDRTPWLTWELYPEAREVILVRDFRDVVCSMLAYNSKRGYLAFGREDVSSDVEFVEKVRKSALSLLRSYKQRSSQVYLVRYEDLILHPTDSLESLFEYLQLDSAESTVESLVRRASEESSDMRQHWTSSEPHKSIGRWRRDLAPSVRATCQETFAEILEDFGYTEDFGVPSGPVGQKHNGVKEDT
jgi:hypothetical protein